MGKLYDLAVKTGSFTNTAGEEKNRYTNIGVVMEKDGKQYMMLNRHFNPAGVPHRDGSDTIMVSMFEPRDDNNSQPQQQQRQQQPQRQQQSRNNYQSSQQYDDVVPF